VPRASLTQWRNCEAALHRAIGAPSAQHRRTKLTAANAPVIEKNNSDQLPQWPGFCV